VLVREGEVVDAEAYRDALDIGAAADGDRALIDARAGVLGYEDVQPYRLAGVRDREGLRRREERVGPPVGRTG